MNTLPGGLWVALATPFDAQNRVDLTAFRRLIRHVAEGGAEVLVPLGSTGEAATLCGEERDRLLEVCLEEANGLPVVAGTGTNDTRTTAELTRRAQELGAAGALVVTPYYNRPTTAGLVTHYGQVADAAPGLPLVVYNVPGRTGLNLRPAALEELWRLPAVVAVKESSGDLGQIAAIAQTLPGDKKLLAGDDGLALASIAVGAVGLVSVVANLLPRPTRAMVEAALRGDLARARACHRVLQPVIDALFLESNPIPLKAGLGLLGLGGDMPRLPLTAATAETRSRLVEALAQAGSEEAA